MNTSDLGDLQMLPPEIRNSIYLLALTAPSAVTVKRHEDRAPGSRQKTNRMKLCGTVLIMKGRQKRRVACANTIGLHLLRASKAAHTEATPVFYHCNSFLFPHFAGLGHFLYQIKEMGFFLADVEVKGIDRGRAFFFAGVLDDLRISSAPKRIAFRVPLRRDENAMMHARSTWKLIKTFVRRKGSDLYFPSQLAAMRSHLHTGTHTNSHGTFSKYTPPPTTQEAQHKRLNAFSFQVPKKLAFKKLGCNAHVIIRNPERRADLFKALMVKCWQEYNSQAEAGESSSEESEQAEDSATDIEESEDEF